MLMADYCGSCRVRLCGHGACPRCSPCWQGCHGRPRRWTRLLPFLLLLTLATPAGAEDDYFLRAKATEHLGDRWYLMRYGTVTLDAGEIEGLRLSLASCPGGVDSPAELFVVPTTSGPFAWQKGWWHPVPYNGYVAEQQVTIANQSGSSMTFKLKASLRCKHFPDGTGP